MRPTNCRTVKGTDPSAAPCVPCSPACEGLTLLKTSDTSQKDRLTRLHSVRSGRRSVLSSLAPRRLPDCQGCQPERSALHAVQPGLRRLDFVEDFRHFSKGQVDSLALGALRSTLRSSLPCAPSTAGLSRVPTRAPRPACRAVQLAKAWLC